MTTLEKIIFPLFHCADRQNSQITTFICFNDFNVFSLAFIDFDPKFIIHDSKQGKFASFGFSALNQSQSVKMYVIN